jgi:26S proteasome non-ATPase regulatory subunit 5
MQLLTSLALCNHGLQYLEEQEIITKLQQMLQRLEEDSIGAFLLPGLIKFFGKLGSQHPNLLLVKYRPFVEVVFRMVDSPDPILQGVAIETIGHIGTSVPGKKVLDSLGNTMGACIGQIGRRIQNSPLELRLRAINALSNLLDLPTDNQTNDIVSLIENWFSSLHNRPMDLVLGVCQQPFADLRLSMFSAVVNLAKLPWGQQMMLNHPSFLEYLLNRTTESDKEGKEAKFEVVKTLVESPTSQEILGNVIMVRVKDYYREGPFYVQVQSEVAIEGSS